MVSKMGTFILTSEGGASAGLVAEGSAMGVREKLPRTQTPPPPLPPSSPFTAERGHSVCGTWGLSVGLVTAFGWWRLSISTQEGIRGGSPSGREGKGAGLETLAGQAP